MREAGWEFLDSWILEACGLISRTKPTQWGGADVNPSNPEPPPNLQPHQLEFFYQCEEEVAQSLYWLATAVRVCRLRLGIFSAGAEGGLCLCTISFVFWPCEKNFCVSAFHSWYSLTLRCEKKWCMYMLKLVDDIEMGPTREKKKTWSQELNCLGKVFLVEQRGS